MPSLIIIIITFVIIIFSLLLIHCHRGTVTNFANFFLVTKPLQLSSFNLLFFLSFSYFGVVLSKLAIGPIIIFFCLLFAHK